jgi:hypothetical protein
MTSLIRIKTQLVYLALIIIVGTGQVACVSISSLQTAETLEKGRTQTTVGGGGFNSEEKFADVDLKTSLPYLEASYREGLGHNVDAGLKYTFPGTLVADGKYRFLEGPNFNMAVGGGLRYLSYESGTDADKVKYTDIDLMIPLYASYRFNDQFVLYATPRYVLRTQSESGGTNAGNKGGSLIGGSSGLKVGKDWGAYLEASYEKQLGSQYSALQYNVSVFWEQPGGFLQNLF